MKKCLAAALGVCFAFGAAMPVVAASADKSFNYSAHANTYMPETGIALPPSVVFKVQSAYDIKALDCEKTPSVALFHVNDTGDVVDKDGEKMATLSEVVRACDNKVIPAFRIESVAASNALYTFISTYSVVDAMVFSHEASIIKSFKAKRPQIQAGICFENPDISNVDSIYAMKDTVNASRALIALWEGDFTKEAVEQFQACGLTCWVDVPAVEYEIYSALYAGVNGLVSNNFSMPIDIMETFEKPTMIRRPYMTGHRGGVSDYTENTIESAKMAYYYGADYVEIDVVRTKDNELVVMHDSTLNRTTNYTGSATIAEMTLAEVQSYTTKDGFAIPDVEDFFDWVKTTDGVKLLVELKLDDGAVVPILKEKIEEAQVEDNIIVIANWDGTHLQELKKLLPNVSTNSTVSYSDLNAATYYSLSNANSFGAGVMHLQKVTKVPKEDIQTLLSQVSVRGIPSYTWTYTSQTDFEEYMFYTTGLTSDGLTYASEQAIAVTTDAQDVYTLGEQTAVDVAYSVQKRQRTGVNINALVRETVSNASVTLACAQNIQGGNKYAALASYTNGKLNVSGSEKGYQIVWLEYLWQNYAKTCEYTVMSKPIKLICGGANAASYEKAYSQEEYEKNKSGCSSTVVSGVFVAVLPVALALAFRKKERKE